MPAPPVQYVKTRDGFDIACFVAGTGRTIIRTPSMWNHVGQLWSDDVRGPFFDDLAERFRLVLYDSRGQGLSTRNLPPTLTINDYITDLETVIARFAPQRFVLDGWSFMGVVALQYAAEHPERVEAVVLHDYLDMHTWPTSPAMGDIASVDWPLYVDTTARVAWPQFDPAFIKNMLFDAMSQDDHILQRRAIGGVSGEAVMSKIRVPVLFLAGRRGARSLSGEEPAKRWSAALPNARLVLFDEAGAGFAQPLAEIIERFLAGLDDAEASLPPDEDALAARSALRRARLTPREAEVLHFIAAGRSNQQIADELVLSLRTVERHITNLYAKINAHGKADATAYALRHGLA